MTNKNENLYPYKETLVDISCKYFDELPILSKEILADRVSYYLFDRFKILSKKLKTEYRRLRNEKR